jgi:hypothetical protein
VALLLLLLLLLLVIAVTAAWTWQQTDTLVCCVTADFFTARSDTRVARIRLRRRGV